MGLLTMLKHHYCCHDASGKQVKALCPTCYAKQLYRQFDAASDRIIKQIDDALTEWDEADNRKEPPVEVQPTRRVG